MSQLCRNQAKTAQNPNVAVFLGHPVVSNPMGPSFKQEQLQSIIDFETRLIVKIYKS